MGHDAQDYTANGPTNIGFRTGGDNTGIKNGVVAAGINIGVHGIGVGEPETTLLATGVFGESARGYGVRGKSVQIGVLGESDKETGVRGVGKWGVEGVVLFNEEEGVLIGVR
jgi:hypothetical protein